MAELKAWWLQRNAAVRVEIAPDRHAYPYFYVPDMIKPGPLLVRA